MTGIDPTPGAPLPGPPDHETQGLRARTAKGMAWTGGQFLAVRLLSLITFVVLARLLTPYDYGVAAIANVFAGLLAMFAAAGFSQALVQKPTLDKEDVDSVFWVSVSVGALLTVVLIGVAWPVAAFFRLPELKPVLWALSPMFLAIAVSSCQAGLMQRQFRFKARARIAVSANLVATIVGVVVAVQGGGYWALVVQTLIVPVFTSVALAVVGGYRPGLRVSRRSYLEIVSTSRQFLGVNLMTFATEQTDKAVVGRVLGTAVLGTYSVAFRLVFIMVDVVARSVQMVALPAFSRLQSDSARFTSGYLSLLRLSSTLAVPSFVFAGVAAEPVVAVVFGDKWLPAVPAMQVFCAYGAVQTMLLYHMTVLQAVGRARTVFWLSAVGTLLQVTAIIAVVHQGIEWVAASFVVRASLVLPLMMLLVARAAGTSLLAEIVRGLLPPILGSTALGTIAYLVVDANLSPLAAASLALCAGVAAYVVVLMVVGRGHLTELRETLLLLRRRSGPGPHPLGEADGATPTELDRRLGL